MSYGHGQRQPGWQQPAQGRPSRDPRFRPPGRPAPGHGGPVGPGGPGGPAGRGGRGGYGPPPAPPRRKRRWRKVVLTALLLVVALFAGTWIYLETSLNREAALTDYEGRPAAGAGTNWLIVGSDSREGLSAEDQGRLNTGAPEGRRTDTIMLMHIPDNATKPTLVSLLRDSYVPIPGKGSNKLNAAYAFGGPALLAQTVERVTDLRIDHYIEIGLGGFADVVDAVGGIEMCPPEPLKDPLAGIDLPAGCQELDGANALGYVRTRVGPRADLDRVIRQREFISALTDKATSVGTLINPFRLFPLLAAAPDAVTVDEGDHLHNLPGLALAMADSELITTTVPFSGSKKVGGQDVILWDKPKALALFEALRTDAEVPANVIVGPPA
ncbi:LCP family protein [Actinokineospora spheciospongiae]|uniref:LCP family protein n=1 Tax=Actinokineospora spheciospongiae TaxID=909613 RepID=UPI000A04B16C|nr:LCP family protein [Actinokineospora spheciospongiae]